MYLESPVDYTIPARGQRTFGAPVGILMLDCIAPWIPGSVGNASTYSAPVNFRTVTGLTVDDILFADAPTHTEAVVAAAQDLVAGGARLIAANCGFMARYQDAVRAAVDVPVFLSSLALVPMLTATLPHSKKLGVLTASSRSLTPAFVASTGLEHEMPRLAIGGLDSAPAFNSAFVACDGQADVQAIAAEVVEGAEKLVADHPDIGCLLLECSELPPYAAAVQQATDLPVFDFISMIEFFIDSLRRTPYKGFV